MKSSLLTLPRCYRQEGWTLQAPLTPGLWWCYGWPYGHHMENDPELLLLEVHRTCDGLIFYRCKEQLFHPEDHSVECLYKPVDVALPQLPAVVHQPEEVYANLIRPQQRDGVPAGTCDDPPQYPQFNKRVVTKAEILKRTKGGTNKLLDALMARPGVALTCEELGEILGKTTTQVRGLVMILGRVEKSLGMKPMDRHRDGKVQSYSTTETARRILEVV